MDMMRILVVGAGMGVVAALPARADDNTPLAVKPGLWEMTSDMQRSGAPPIPPEALAKMSPEQRQKVEQAMQGAMGPQHRVDKHCVTAEDIKKGFDRMDETSRGQCTRKVTASSATLHAGTFSCAGQGNRSGSYRVEAKSPESVVANWNMTLTRGGDTMTMKNDMQGKWLGADCGDLKEH
ncbi:MAG TPA: DUF3617 domain-containing protein [Stellaceae bacterium]|nr:DUF3617 domain-containing protein [Stellaceae bacterium]